MIKTVAKRLIVKKIEEEKKTTIITVTSNEPFKASVIALGSDVDVQVSVGDVVILPAHTGSNLEIEGEKYLAVYEDQILAVIGK